MARVPVPLGGKKAAGRVTYVSPAKYDLVMAYRWHVWERRRPNGSISGPYAITTVRGADGRRHTLGMHQLIMGCRYVDHEDGDPLNNTDGNLRKATISQNNANTGQRADATLSRFKGVTRVRYKGRRQYRAWKSWRARIQVSGKRRTIGYYATEEEARDAYVAAAAEAFGEFAHANRGSRLGWVGVRLLSRAEGGGLCMSTATFVCLAAAFAALAIAVAFGALVIMLARRVESLAADLAGVESTRSSCPDRGRITRLEDFAAGGPAGGPRGRHGRPQRPPGPDPGGPRARWGRAPGDTRLLGAPPAPGRR